MVVLWLTVCSKSSKDECCQVNVEVPWSDEPLFTLSSARRSARRLHDQTWTRACGVVRLRSVCTFIRRYPFCQRFGVKISLLDLLKIPCCRYLWKNRKSVKIWSSCHQIYQYCDFFPETWCRRPVWWLRSTPKSDLFALQVERWWRRGNRTSSWPRLNILWRILSNRTSSSHFRICRTKIWKKSTYVCVLLLSLCWYTSSVFYCTWGDTRVILCTVVTTAMLEVHYVTVTSHCMLANCCVQNYIPVKIMQVILA